MTEELITFETAKLAKEKGFNELCRLYYGQLSNYPSGYPTGMNTNNNSSFPNHECSAPTQAFLQRWLREEHKISCKVDDFHANGRLRFDFNVSPLGSQDDNPQGVFESYEEALEEALQTALKQID